MIPALTWLPVRCSAIRLAIAQAVQSAPLVNNPVPTLNLKRKIVQ